MSSNNGPQDEEKSQLVVDGEPPVEDLNQKDSDDLGLNQKPSENMSVTFKNDGDTSQQNKEGSKLSLKEKMLMG